MLEELVEVGLIYLLSMKKKKKFDCIDHVFDIRSVHFDIFRS